MNGSFTFETDADLRNVLKLISLVPDAIDIKDPLYCMVTQDVYNAKCPSELGDGRKLFLTQFQNFRENKTHVCTKTANIRYHAIDGEQVPNGNMYSLGKDELIAWVNYFGVDAFYVECPIESEVIDNGN